MYYGDQENGEPDLQEEAKAAWPVDHSKMKA